MMTVAGAAFLMFALVQWFFGGISIHGAFPGVCRSWFPAFLPILARLLEWLASRKSPRQAKPL